jgi:SAM-dependent methyltransferase
VDWRNATGRPLASPSWLEAHHQAKLHERISFAKQLAKCQPKRIVDLGCATGLWLDVLNQVLPPACEFVGLDSDPESLAIAETRSLSWDRRSTFRQCDIESDSSSIPAADLTLIFNVFPYLKDPAGLLAQLGGRQGAGAIAVRQYDGGALRFGPMDPGTRAQIEDSLRASVNSSTQFKHYDMDHVFSLIHSAPFSNRQIKFELFERTAPFSEEFIKYFEGMMEWTLNLLSENSAAALRNWRDLVGEDGPSDAYFFEVDLTAVLS